jgi:ketosteroid isomerase-like protein
MSEQNVQLVRDCFAAMERRSIETLVANADPRIEFVNPEYAVEPGTRYGLEGFRAALRTMLEIFDEVRFELKEIVDLEDKVVVTGSFTARGKGSGAEVTQPMGQVFTIEDGRLLRLQWFNSPVEARAAAEIESGLPGRGDTMQ